MKKIKYLFCIAAMGMSLTSCEDLELQPKGLMDESTLYDSNEGVQTYLVRLYNNLPIEDFNYGVNGDQSGYRNHDNNQWQACKSFSGAVCAETMGRNTGNGGEESYDYWPYSDIRQVNNFIENVPTYSSFDEKTNTELIAEGRFLRAFYYFGMAKRYGGVPIITDVQDPLADKDSLQLPRSTEYDTWKFIYEDLKFAMENGAEDSKSLARANRYTAAALMTRAMLFAASVAKYSGTVGTTGPAVNAGLQTMTSDHAEEFYQYVREAAEVVKKGGYSLHQGDYTEVFLKENSDEDLLVKRFVGADLASIGDKKGMLQHWDATVLPIGDGMSAFVGCAIQPVWDLIGMYEHPAVVDEAGRPVRFNSLADFANSPELEPRCKANFWFPGMVDPVSGKTFDLQAGVYATFPGYAAEGCSAESDENDYTRSYRFRASNPGTVVTDKQIEWEGKTSNFAPGTKINGLYGLAWGQGDEGYSYTGVFIRKYVDTNSPVSHRAQWGGTQSWKVFRYAEVLLNLAEADYELYLINGDASLKQEAEDIINQIRQRAGCKNMFKMKDAPEYVFPSVYGDDMHVDENLQYIRDERERELCLENFKYWDMRRWRVGHLLFSNSYRCTVFYGYLVYDEQKYIFIEEPARKEGRTFSWNKSQYYRQIPGGEINKNPNLMRNDGF